MRNHQAKTKRPVGATNTRICKPNPRSKNNKEKKRRTQKELSAINRFRGKGIRPPCLQDSSQILERKFEV